MMALNHIGDESYRSSASAPSIEGDCMPHTRRSNNMISIAERRAAKCGFNVQNMNVQPRFTLHLTSSSPSPYYFTVPPGISPSALLDSPVMLPNSQGPQLSPTTGTFQFPSPNDEKLKLKRRLVANGNVDPCSVTNNFMRPQNKEFERLYDQHPVDLKETDKKDCLEKQQKGAYFPKEVTRSSEDGYYWRKYGQKHVKGSEYPRSYYKCTHTNCLVKKKVERSHDGHITEIVYKGSHNHPKPQPLKQYGVDSPEIKNENSNSTLIKNVGLDSKAGLNEAYSSNPSIQRTYNDFNHSDVLHGSTKAFDAQEFSIVEDQDEASPESMSFHDEDEEQNDESESKKRKTDNFAVETNVSRSTREPRVVVQIQSDIDILDDGYRWRKYGQKVVKGNPNPRSYYKCTSAGCPVRKQVERAANDLKSVITTYEAKHNHEVPTTTTTATTTTPMRSTGNVSNFSSLATSNDASKQGKQVVQHLPPPLYFNKTKPLMFSYNDHQSMRPSSHSGSNNLLNFGSSSVNYPISFPPFHYGSLLMNGSFIKNNLSSTSNIYPLSTSNLPEYMSTMNTAQAALSAVNVNNFHYINYSAASNQGQEIRECYGKSIRPKDEIKDEVDNIYDACMSIPGNGMM